MKHIKRMKIKLFIFVLVPLELCVFGVQLYNILVQYLLYDHCLIMNWWILLKQSISNRNASQVMQNYIRSVRSTYEYGLKYSPYCLVFTFECVIKNLYVDPHTSSEYPTFTWFVHLHLWKTSFRNFCTKDV